MQLFSFVLLFSPLYSTQQIPHTVNTIAIRTHMSDAEAYQKLVDLLSQQGWTRDYDDSRSKALVTHYKPTTSTWRLRLITSVSMGSIRLWGESSIGTPGTSTQHEPVTDRGQEGQMNKVNFGYINQVALPLKEAISSSSIDYTSSAQ